MTDIGVDPDGDQLTYHSYQDKVSDSFQQDVQINGAASAVARVEISSDTDGKGIMIVLEVTDNGTPALTRYRRIMLHAGGDTDSVVPAAPTNLVATTASVVPAAPMNLVATTASNSRGQYTFPIHTNSISACQINLSWEDNPDKETIFRIESGAKFLPHFQTFGPAPVISKEKPPQLKKNLI